jgi:uncharacterized protein YneF (UPF0154 family)
MSDDKYGNIPKGKDGKPTKAFMEKIYNENPKLHKELIEQFFTTKSGMGENPFEGTVKKIFEKVKGKKDGK